MGLLLAVLLSFDDTALAGAAYQEAEEALAQSHYDVAIRKAQEALRLEPKETDRLMYRDRQGRQKIAYYPHYLWARARTLQARDEKDPATRLQELREAITHLELSAHPQARALAEATKQDLALAEKAAAPPEVDPTLASLRAEVGALADQERFEDAFDRMAKERERWDRFPAERDQAKAALEGRRQGVVARYERTLGPSLETAAAASPLEKPDLIPSLLRGALPPPAVLRAPAGPFLWTRDFLALYDRELPVLRKPAGAAPDRLRKAADAFEESASRAAAVGSLPGSRLAARAADALREVRLAALWEKGDETTLEPALKEWEQVLKSREAVLTPLAGPATADLLTPSREVLRRSAARLDERRALRTELQSWIDRAAAGLADRSTMSNPAALRTVASEESALEGRPRWDEMPADLRAGVLFARAVLDLVADALGGESTTAGTLARVRKAKKLKPDVDASWAEKLSPKILARVRE